jgi:hypothetical protein
MIARDIIAGRNTTVYSTTTAARAHPKVRSEALELRVPVCQGGQRGNDHKGAPDAFRLGEVRERADALDRLAKTHFVCKNPVDALRGESRGDADQR